MTIKFMNVEKVKISTIFFVLAISFPFFVFSMAVGNYFFYDNHIAQGFFEELFRFLLVLICFRLYNLVAIPAFILSIFEFAFGIFINFLFFKPDYLSHFGYGMMYALSVSTTMVAFGFFCGAIYSKARVSGEHLYWCLLTIAPLKISIYIIDDYIKSYFGSDVLLISSMISLSTLLIFLSIKIYKKTRFSISSQI